MTRRTKAWTGHVQHRKHRYFSLISIFFSIQPWCRWYRTVWYRYRPILRDRHSLMNWGKLCSYKTTIFYFRGLCYFFTFLFYIFTFDFLGTHVRTVSTGNWCLFHFSCLFYYSCLFHLTGGNWNLSQDSSNTGLGKIGTTMQKSISDWCLLVAAPVHVACRAYSCAAIVFSLLSLLNFLKGTNTLNDDTPTYSLFDFP